jgi:uncharacterized damage-inducible protein DinB
MKTPQSMHRRRFLKTSAALAVGLPDVLLAAAAPEEGPNVLGPRAGYSPQIGTLVSMLTWMRNVVVNEVQSLTTVPQLDYLHDAKANSIGALLLHLAATERLYQIHTFEGVKWGAWDETTRKQWGVAMALGTGARKTIKGNGLTHYVEALREVREHTLSELRGRDDDWLMRVDEEWSWGPTNNLCKWFHVCEHESNHNGQVKWLKRRLPNAPASEDSLGRARGSDGLAFRGS